MNEPGDNVKSEEKSEQVQIKQFPPPSTWFRLIWNMTTMITHDLYGIPHEI